MYQIVTELVLI